MQISQEGINLVKKFEGFEPHTYDDGVGTLTIGYGHTEGVEWGQVVNQAQAEEILKNDLVKYCYDVQALIDNHTIKFNVNQNMFDSLVSFCFNLGAGNLKMLVTGRNEKEVADSITKYVYAGGKILQGLVYRRQAERELFLKPVETIQNNSNEYVENGTATVCVGKLNIRDNPSLNSNIVGSYNRFEKFSYNHVIINDGYVWVRYTSYSGKIRFVAVKEISSNKRFANCD